jgi:hypothetical protein
MPKRVFAFVFNVAMVLEVLAVALLLVSTVVLTVEASTPSGPGGRTIKYRRLRAIPCKGLYQPGGVYSEYIRAMRLKTDVVIEDGFVKSDRETLPCFFLAPDKMVVEEMTGKGYEDGTTMILRSIVPVPIKAAVDVEASILAALNQRRQEQQDDRDGVNMASFSGAVITDRNRGVYDNLIPLFSKWLRKPEARKAIYDKMRLKGNAISPYHAFLSALKEQTGLVVTGILVEVADSPNPASLSLGAAILVAKSDKVDDWTLNSKTYRSICREERRSDDAKLVECYMDEAYGFHLATKLPFYCAESLYERISIDGILRKESNSNDDQQLSIGALGNNQQMVLSAPYFSNMRDSISWQQQLEESRARPAKKVPRVNEIKDATTFLKMRVSEKRGKLDCSGMLRALLINPMMYVY